MPSSIPPLAPEAEAIESVQDRVIDTVTATQQEVLETIDSTGHAVFEGLARTQKEMADFIAERIRQDLSTQQAMLRCRSLDEFRDLQSRFLRTAFDQYSGEASRLIGIGRDIAARSFERD
jgi:hypothetical protein